MRSSTRFVGLVVAAVIPLGSSPVAFAEALAAPRVAWSDGRFVLEWAAEPGVVLQRSGSLAESGWRDISETLGQSSYAENSVQGSGYYRLARYALEDKAQVRTAWEDRLSAKVAGRIRLATLPPASRQPRADGSVPGENPEKRSPAELPPYTWVSQPGMIRAYGAAKELAEAFPLYSSSKETLSNVADLAAERTKLANWEAQPERFTDLNEPIGQGDGRLFPILDPRAATVAKVEGFSFEGGGERLPMPVEWLYVLKDGTMKTAEADGRVPGASAENPMTARVAYWTDDESAKVNVNTAAEAIPWDTPRCDTPVERGYARFQPVTNEVQRYPGHPATTCLSALLYPGRSVDGDGNALTEAELERIFALTPRVVQGGSRSGTVKGTAAITFDADPLHASAEDWAAKAGSPSLAGLVTTHSSAPEVSVHGRPRMSLWPVHAEDSAGTRSSFDRHSVSRSTWAGRGHHFLRKNRASAHEDSKPRWPSLNDVETLGRENDDFAQ